MNILWERSSSFSAWSGVLSGHWKQQSSLPLPKSQRLFGRTDLFQILLLEDNITALFMALLEHLLMTVTSLPVISVIMVAFSVLSVLGVVKLMRTHSRSVKSDLDEEMDEDALEERRRLIDDQDCHEAEVCFGNESGLRKLFMMCDKNPGHVDFIPIRDFNIDHLPQPYRDKDVVDWIRAEADATVRLSVRHISVKRPDFYPNSEKRFPFSKFKGKSKLVMTGTGYLGGVFKYTEEDKKSCKCKECCEPDNKGTPKEIWAEITLGTAAHVVCDEAEARHTTCHFFYDERKTDLNTLLKLEGLGIGCCFIDQDRCELVYATHDMKLVDTLEKIWSHRKALRTKVWNKYSSTTAMCDTSPDHRMCVCVSHPHGSSKKVTIGTWTHRQKIRTGKFNVKDGRVFDGVCTQYTYTTPTCRGSSGALVFSPVYRLALKKNWYSGLFHQHSEGSAGNVNRSGLEWEPEAQKTPQTCKRMEKA